MGNRRADKADRYRFLGMGKRCRFHFVPTHPPYKEFIHISCAGELVYYANRDSLSILGGGFVRYKQSHLGM